MVFSNKKFFTQCFQNELDGKTAFLTFSNMVCGLRPLTLIEYKKQRWYFVTNIIHPCILDDLDGKIVFLNI